MARFDGKRALVLGVANKRSIAWAIARRLADEGAELAFTFQGERIEGNVRELAATVGSKLVTPCDVRADEDLDRVFGEVAELWDGRLDLRIHLPGPRDELTDLADTFDAMLDRVEQTIDEERRFAANASHELRTPHAIIRTMVEVTQADPAGRDVEMLLQRIGATNERAIAATDALLALARAGRGVARAVATSACGGGSAGGIQRLQAEEKLLERWVTAMQNRSSSCPGTRCATSTSQPLRRYTGAPNGCTAWPRTSVPSPAPRRASWTRAPSAPAPSCS